MRCFYFILSEMKNNCYQVFHHLIKSNSKSKEFEFIEPFDDLVAQGYSKCTETLIKNQDLGSNKTSVISNFMPKILRDDEISENINSLNSKQKEVFIVVHMWVKIM